MRVEIRADNRPAKRYVVLSVRPNMTELEADTVLDNAREDQDTVQPYTRNGA
jgi:hypothetical protein